jgi:hypothetical protein
MFTRTKRRIQSIKIHPKKKVDKLKQEEQQLTSRVERLKSGRIGNPETEGRTETKKTVNSIYSRITMTTTTETTISIYSTRTRSTTNTLRVFLTRRSVFRFGDNEYEINPLYDSVVELSNKVEKEYSSFLQK